MELRSHLISELKKIEIPNLLSLSIIGSFVEKKGTKQVEDVDIYIILGKLDAVSFRKIESAFQRLCTKLSTEKMLFLPEFRAGAFKPDFEKGKQKVQLHVLINTPDMLEKKSPMVALDWKMNNMKIKGKTVNKFLKTARFSSSDLVEGRDGLLYFKELLKNDKKAWMEWTIENGNISRIKKEAPITQDDMFELIQFVVIQGFTNFIRLKKPNFPKKEADLIKEAEKMLSAENVNFLKQIFKIKHEIRTKGKAKFDLKTMKKKASFFTDHLIEKAQD